MVHGGQPFPPVMRELPPSLGASAGLSEVSIKNIEPGATDARGSTLAAIETAFMKAGVVFLDSGDTRDGGQGVRLKR